MRIWADSVEEKTAADPGTSDLSLIGPTAGNRPFSVIGDGNECDYRVETVDLAIWEIGSGTYDAGTNTLARDEVLAGTSGPGVKVDLVGICTVYLTLTSRWIQPLSEQSGGAFRLPLVTGERTADGEPIFVSDVFGQCIGVLVE